MPLNTFALGVALTPAVLQTLISHYLHRKSLRHKPNVHLTYDEAIRIMREFLAYAAKHPVEDLQAFSCQKVPVPHWVKLQTVTVSEDYLSSAADAINKQLGPKGIERVGGSEWWQWRGPAEDLKGEWIEMKDDYNEREQTSRDHPSQKRIMLYIHGGAYYFASVDTHRYQMQRHARKLKGRVFAPKYRLAPQYPFPCSLQDSLAAYLYLLAAHDPKEIIFAGDSAGGGMVLSMLVILRDQGIPLPAGAILISPWVDLTHSFPSIVADNPGDYIPQYGFRHKPSAAWPPPNADELRELKKGLAKTPVSQSDALKAIPNDNSQAADTAAKGYSAHMNGSPDVDEESITVTLDGETVEVKDQIHMYTTNELLTHPLVSPILQPSLGGLPPLLIQSGGGEMLRDEHFYVAHKAANPAAYPPSDRFMAEHDPTREILHKHPGTHVQLQVWDDLCHVAPTLSFTRPAKYMFRAIAQFGAWALACAQKAEMEIADPRSGTSSESDSIGDATNGTTEDSVSSVGKAGDPLPAFKDRMIRQRVDKRGNVYPLDPPSSCPVLQIPNSDVGAFNPDLVRGWLVAKREWDDKFAKEKLRVQRQRIKELAYGLQAFKGELPPPSSLAARRTAPGVLPSKTGRKSYPMTMWSRVASKQDERIIARDQQKGRAKRTSVDAGRAGASMDEAGEHKAGTLPTIDPSTRPGITIQEPTDVNDAPNTSERASVASPKSSTDALAPSLTKSTSRLILLPEYEGKQLLDENASTRTLFREAGAIPTGSDAVWARLRQRPLSHAGSGTIRSEFTSELPEDSSTIGDEKSLAVTTTGVDAASTRAVFHAGGVVSPLSDDDSMYRSFDATDGGDIEPSVSGSADAGAASLNGAVETDKHSRPTMPNREFFKTAEEFVAY
ncbi:alpha/beta-hydrolase [Aspergillus sclerotioniger CBS 115572]|uniref:Alpha/beta-hydrolase n=1 Tax=Aspergillus sclerotioniger CBS 115572 TaxID=1450535 RepID=A0A317WC34_9EURO|nr:alpha/beta-hydrolase [Aspergillus sclerotioniger CBS 115572]PWY83779.1 alpha/beta-hydrolase [Aspergillus sclerotioniger CBS 115572]